MESCESKRSGASPLNSKEPGGERSHRISLVLRLCSIGICLLLVATTLSSLIVVAPSSPDWQSGSIEEIHVVETARGGYSRPYYSVAGSRDKLYLLSDESSGTLEWSQNLQLGGLMVDGTTYGEKIEWNSVDISVDPVRVVAGLRNSEIKVYDVARSQLWPSGTDCGDGEVRAVAITPNADFVVAGSDLGPGGNSGPYLCGFDGKGNTIFKDYVTTSESGYKITDIDIAESGKYITVTLAGPTSIVVLYDYEDRDYTGNDVFLDLPNRDKTLVAGGEVAYNFKIYNEGGVTAKVTVTREFSDPVPGWTAEFLLDGMVSRLTSVDVTLSAGEVVRGKMFVGAPSSALPGNYANIELEVTANGDPKLSDGEDSVMTHTNVATHPWTNTLPTAQIDSIGPPVAVVDDDVQFTGHGIDPDPSSSIDSYRWTSSLDGLLCEGSTCNSFTIDTLSVGAHTIYFHVYDNMQEWSLSTRGNVVVKSSSTVFPSELFREEDGGMDPSTAGISEISRDGRVVAIGDLRWGNPWVPWNIEYIDSEERNYRSSIALDSDDYPHVSYRHHIPGGQQYTLRYAKWTGSDWSVETVDSSAIDVGGHSSIAIDSNDRPHISYVDTTNSDLKYAGWTGSKWKIEVVDDDQDLTPHSTSLALDSNDKPHIAYYDDYGEDLKYAEKTGSKWKIEVVDSDGVVGLAPSIAVDEDDYPHISYYDDTNADLKYAKWTGSEWSIEVVDYSAVSDCVTSIALDSDYYPHISYYDGYLKYVKWTGTDWSIMTVDPTAYAGCSNSLALDYKDRAHISYQDAGYLLSRMDLKYARWTGSNWALETVDSDEEVGAQNSIAVDSEGCPHISYNEHVLSHSNIKYATRCLSSMVTYYTESDWTGSLDTDPRWTYRFVLEPEVTTISLSEWGSFIFVGTYDDSDAEVFVFNKELVNNDVYIIEQFTPYSIASDARIWSSDFDGIGMGYPDSEDGILILGTSSDGVSTHYNFFRYDWSDDRPTGYGTSTIVWYHKITEGPDVSAVSVSTGDMEPYPGTPDLKGAVFIGTRWGTTNRVYYWEVPA